MSKKNIIKMICLNLVIAAVNIALFSQGAVTLDPSGDTLAAAAGWTLALMSSAAFCYGNWSLLSAEDGRNGNTAENKVRLYTESDLTTVNDHINALEMRRSKKVFDAEIAAAEDQLKRLQEKENAIGSVLSQQFSPDNENYEKFSSVITSVKELFLANDLKIINRMLIFDDNDYRKVHDKVKYNTVPDNGLKMSSGTAAAQLKIYNEQIESVRELIEDNENILVKLNDLLLEITKLGEDNLSPAENTTALDEMDVLISQTKYYNM